MAAKPAASISVVIPAYRAWATLPRVLSALQPQIQGTGREAIVVDSSGGARAAELARDFPWARVVALPERALPGRARNVGTKEAAGDTIAFLDADAVPAPGWLDELERSLGAGLDAVGGAVLNGTPWHPIGTAGYLLEFANWLPRRRGPLWHAATCNLVVRRSAFEALGGFPEDIFPGEDTVFTFRLACHGRLGFAPSARVAHLNRRRVGQFLLHQHRLGRAFAEVCTRVEYPSRNFARPWLIPLTVPLRLASLCRRLRSTPYQAAGAVLLLPLLLVGLVAWAIGVAHGRGTPARTAAVGAGWNSVGETWSG